MDINNLTREELESQLNLNITNKFFLSKKLILSVIFIILFGSTFISIISLQTIEFQKSFFILLPFFTFIGILFLVGMRDSNKSEFNDTVIKNYINKNYFGIKEILDYDDFSNECIDDSYKFFDINNLLIKKFININNIPDYIIEGNELFKIKSMYLYSFSTKGGYTKIGIITKTKFNKSINYEGIINENIFLGTKIYMNLFVYIFATYCVFFPIIVLYIINIGDISLIITNKININYYNFLYILLIVPSIIGLITYILKYYFLNRNYSIKNNIYTNNEYDSNFSNGFTETINNFLEKKENRKKSYSFYLNNDCLYIKYDFQKTLQMNFFISFALIDYILEFKEHILLARELEKYYR